MSNAIFNQIAGGLITLNDSLRAAFLPDGVKCFLIKRAEFSGTRWTVVKELNGGWFIEFNEYRGQFKLLYATRSAGFSDEIAQTSFIACGVPNANGEMDVFSIDPERRDIIPPTGTNAQWKIYVDKAVGERFTPPSPIISAPASGYFEFTSNDLLPDLENGIYDGVLVNGFIFVFDSPERSGGSVIAVGADLGATLDNAAALITNFVDGEGGSTLCDAERVGSSTLKITFSTPGAFGNTITIGVINADGKISASGATLLGGS